MRSLTSPPRRELTVRGMILGALITAIFTASNVYLGLKVGLTFASSIPAAVISMAVLRVVSGTSGRGGVLENNMVQTQASAAGTLSSIIFVLPALVMAGVWQHFAFWPVAVICTAGGMLGVVFTIPLRRALVIDSGLPYPEGVAAAEVLRVGDAAAEIGAGPDTPRESARALGLGTAISALVALATGGLRLLSDGLTLSAGTGPVFRLTAGFSLALLGAGYLVGLAGGLAMLVGLLLAWGVLTPWLTAVLPHPAGLAPAAFALDVWRHRVRFIGAGTIGVAALWTLGTLAGPVASGLRAAVRGTRSAPAAADHPGFANPDYDRDLPPRVTLPLALVLLAVLFAAFLCFLPAPLSAGPVGVALLCALFCAGFGFLIAAACGYMAGIVGSSSSPISGIAILAVLCLSLMLSGLLSLGWLPWPGPVARPLAMGLVIFVATAVLAAATISNDNLQDLKTGQLVGASPWKQQVALLIGCVSGAVVIPPVLNLLYTAYGFAGALPRPGMDPEQALATPQAALMTTLANGVVLGSLDWTPVLQGVGLGLLVIGADIVLRRVGGSRGWRLPPLAVGIGLYLPPEVTVALVVGAVLSKLIAMRLAHRDAASRKRAESRAVMLASGLIVGESLVGVLLAGLVGGTGRQDVIALVGPGFAPTASVLGTIVFCAAAAWFGLSVTRRRT